MRQFLIWAVCFLSISVASLATEGQELRGQDSSSLPGYFDGHLYDVQESTLTPPIGSSTPSSSVDQKSTPADAKKPGPVKAKTEEPKPEAEKPVVKANEKFKPTVAVTGFFQLDAGFYYQDAANRLTLGDIDDGLGFRRTRLAAKGKVAEDTSYLIEFDFAQSQPRFLDVWMQQDDTRFGNIRIGRFRQPFGMSELTSVRELPFLERTLTFVQSPFRETGVMFFDASCDERRTWAVSGFRYIGDNFGNVYSDTGGYGIASRLTAIAVDWGPNHLWHVGVDYSYATPKNGVIQLVNTNEFAAGENPNNGPAGLSVLPFVGVPPFVNTGPVNADSIQFYNFESALAFGRFAIQSEARWTGVEQTGGPTASFPGVYIQARYVLTGEEIPFIRSQAVFGRVVPLNPISKCGGRGAWEMAGRISHIDLNDAGVTGRRLTNYTSGLNWYWNKNTKLQFNYIHSQLDDVVVGESDADTFAVRAQLDF